MSPLGDNDENRSGCLDWMSPLACNVKVQRGHLPSMSPQAGDEINRKKKQPFGCRVAEQHLLQIEAALEVCLVFISSQILPIFFPPPFCSYIDKFIYS
mmetsp:Transcript_24392/g.69581  ORF Transcript_24392/g.69581 Transcript_24392/m.69581 type:complete len:98 (-) Transcript_24392:215-508(-)